MHVSYFSILNLYPDSGLNIMTCKRKGLHFFTPVVMVVEDILFFLMAYLLILFSANRFMNYYTVVKRKVCL